MTSVGANLLLFAYSTASPFHARAQAFLRELSPPDAVALRLRRFGVTANRA